MKLTIEKLAPYLPYGLKAYHAFEKELLEREVTLYNVMNFINGDTNAKIALRPLSDLTRDEYNFIYEKETDYDSIYDWLWLDVESRLATKFSYSFWQELFHYHFDIFELIDKGLAIDINTLKP